MGFLKGWLILAALPTLFAGAAQNNRLRPDNPLRQTNAAYFQTEEARRTGDQVLLFQRVTGGWPKNVDMVSPMDSAARAQVAAQRERRNDSTTDNRATTTQMGFLARLYRATGDVRYRDAFRRGVEFLLSGQYENGGWPQFWPDMHGYQRHITFNDDAMVNTLVLFRDAINGTKPYGGDLVDEPMRRRMEESFDRAIDCILKCQIVYKGRPTVWCQQHDRETFAPAPARAYELPSFCSQESVGIVKLLLSLPRPDQRVKRAVHAAMRWFDRNRIPDLRYARKLTEEDPDTYLKKEKGTATWARYYDLRHCRPYVCDRDGKPRRRLEDIGTERRNGYSWYNEYPAELYPLYERWAAEHDPGKRLKLHPAKH